MKKCTLLLIILLATSCTINVYRKPENPPPPVPERPRITQSRQNTGDNTSSRGSGETVVREKKKENSTPVKPPVRNTRKEPIPPEYVDFWVVVRRGAVVEHRCVPDDYPGRIIKRYHRRESGSIVVYMESTYDSSVRWKMTLPRENGEYYVRAYLLQ